MNILGKIRGNKRFSKNQRGADNPAEKAQTKPVSGEKKEIPCTELTAPYAFPFSNNHHEPGEDLLFTEPDTKQQKKIVDMQGYFCDFPGVEDAPDESSDIREYMAKAAESKRICFCAYFEPFGKDQYVVWWTIWPDGRYWEDDDGFGGTSDAEIQLYALMDRHGCYTTPFRLRSVGADTYVWGYRNRNLRFQRSPGGTRGIDLDRVDRKTDLLNVPIRQIPQTRIYLYGRNTGFKIGSKVYSSIEQLTETVRNEDRQIFQDCYGQGVFHMTVPVSREGESVLELRNGGMPQYMAEDTPLPFQRHYYYMFDCCTPALHCVSYTENREDLYVKEDLSHIDEDTRRKMQYLGILPKEDIGIFPICF